MKKADIPITRLHEMFRYDAGTGSLIRRVRQKNSLPGSVAGTRMGKSGSLTVSVDGVEIYASQVVFAMHHGRWPDWRIGFFDRDPTNTRLENMHEMTRSTGRIPSAKELRSMFMLDPSNWRLRLKVPRAGGAVGSVAGSETGDGYRRVAVCGVNIPEHRVIFALVNGRWPKEGMVVDHIDGDSRNNDPMNLREVTPQENSQNRKRPSKSNRTGTKVPGVSWNSALGKYAVNLKIDGKVRFLGSFECLSDAEGSALLLRREHYSGNTL